MFDVDTSPPQSSARQQLGAVSARSDATSISPQAAVAELGQAALSGLDVEGVFTLALNLICSVLEVEFAKVVRIEKTGQPLVLAAARGWHDDVVVGKVTVAADAGSQAGFTLMRSEPVLVSDWSKERRFAPPQLLTDHGVQSGITVLIQDRRGPCGVLGAHSAVVRDFTSAECDFLRSVANIIGSAVESQIAREQIQEQALVTERRLRYHEALAKCANSLLSSSGDNRLEEALEALLGATQATYVFVERNVHDPDLGFCSRTVAEMEATEDGAFVQQHNPYWEMVPWDRMPTSRLHMERGEPFIIIPSELVGMEREQYEDDPIPVQSELDIPIFVAGVWDGLIGFSETETATDWSDEDLTLLTTAAAMIGAFWEREAATEHLEELIRSKDQFLASVSHELRTPLTAVVGFNEILRDSKDSLSLEEREELLETVVRQGSDLTNIVNDLLVAARADIGKLNVTAVSINVRAQAAQVLEAFAGDGVAQLQVVGDAERAIGDPDRTRQIIRNLVSNAIRYGGDTISVEASSDEEYAYLTVSDSGDPIPAQDHERIFEAYQRAHDARGVTGSIGLGLAISRQLARLMHGDVAYHHTGTQSVFTLSLPLNV